MFGRLYRLVSRFFRGPFIESTWRERATAPNGRNGASEAFARANAGFIDRAAADPATGLRMVVNIPAQAFLDFIREKRYRNAYDLRQVAGSDKGPTPTRRRVDALIFGEADPAEFYFGALAFGGTGVRFYGEFCMVLHQQAVPPDTQIMDRNSYELLWPPLSEDPDPVALARRLAGRWGADASAMAASKVLPALARDDRRATIGQVSDALLRDEDFVEVHKRRHFGPNDVYEVREAPQDVALEEHLRARATRGHLPTMEALTWVTRRELVAQALSEAGIKHRIVLTSGRTDRWG